MLKLDKQECISILSELLYLSQSALPATNRETLFQKQSCCIIRILYVSIYALQLIDKLVRFYSNYYKNTSYAILNQFYFCWDILDPNLHIFYRLLDLGKNKRQCMKYDRCLCLGGLYVKRMNLPWLFNCFWIGIQVSYIFPHTAV